MELEIVEFLDDEQLKLGLVLKQAASRIQVTDQNGKQHSLNKKQLVLTHSRKVTAFEFTEFSRLYLESVTDLADEIDTELLWESLPDKGGDLDPAEAAEIYFGNADPVSRSAVIRAAGSDSIHFKRKGTHISIRSPQQAAEQKHLQTRKAEKETLNNQFSAWALAVLDGGNKSALKLLPEFLPLLNSLEQCLTNEAYVPESWLNELLSAQSGPFRSRAETIVMLLVGGQRLPEDADPFILESGIPLEFDSAALEEAELFTEPESMNLPGALETGVVISIDDAETEEIDDAVSIKRVNDSYLLGIHIADMFEFVGPGTPLDREAAQRCTSVYLPHRQIRMLPERISCGLASLFKNRARPVLSCSILLGPDLEMLEWSFSRAYLEVQDNLTYSQADKIMRSADDPSDAPPGLKHGLEVLEKFTDILLRNRMDKGALLISRPEVKITFDNSEIQLELIDPESVSRRIISELMILYNRLASEFASAQQLPFIYRTQNKPENEIPHLPEKGYDNYAAFKLFSMMEGSGMSVKPSPHFGLGLDSYAQVSSPIRRYTDLLNQRQICSILEGQEPPHPAEQLSEHLAEIDSSERSRRNLERKISRLFTLRHLLKSKNGEFEIVVLQPNKAGYLVETAAECFRGFLNTSETLQPGTTVTAKISRIDPESDILQFVKG